MSMFANFPTDSIENQHLRLEYLSQAGPRIVRLFLAGSEENQLVEIPDISQDTPYGAYLFLGGHRLWHAPEALPRTYIPDDKGLEVEKFSDGIRLTGSTEEATGIQKSIEIRLQADRPALAIHHAMRNNGLWPVDLAPWAITQLPLGGLAIFPQTEGPLDADGLLPNRQLVFWPYSQWNDPRLQLHDDYILIRAEPKLPPIKIGYLNRRGWLGYLRGGVLFTKQFFTQLDRPHVDFGCNCESYCNHLFIELETLGPLTRLEPGQMVSHTEIWAFYQAEGIPQTHHGISELVKSLALSSP